MLQALRNALVHRAQFMDPAEQSIPTLALLDTNGKLYANAQPISLDQATAERIYDACVMTRALDQRMNSAQRQGRISFYMTCIGEEAAVIGSAAALDGDDVIMAQYREQGALAYRGFSLEQFMDQMFANQDDLGKGRQMPIHYGSRALNYVTISSPLATQIPQAAGYAYGLKLENKQNCVICYFGEGAASEGDFHAGLNMAAVHKAPVIFFCRNNGYAISTPTNEQFAGDGIASRAAGYGMKAIRVDGNDMLAVYEATKLARAYVLEHDEPILIEAMTYRMGAHSTSDNPSAYRTKDEEQAWQSKDPMQRFSLWLTAQGWLTEERQQALQAHYQQAVLAAMKVAEVKPAPALKTLFEDVYANMPWHLQEQLAQLTAHVAKYAEHYPNSAGSI
ncbi:thiamine pyrophosphate-dependent dehydrogenase E1 component subunit alpha [Pseudomonas sp. F1_0610]|uniref:thiamine pyrophosphate-dependent dehydrogenase E1 component subunit alpha n=1 Tax=Pseudomonas sp. F1_0610 TaxID=3114284 RepID=UPI0039C09794